MHRSLLKIGLIPLLFELIPSFNTELKAQEDKKLRPQVFLGKNIDSLRQVRKIEIYTKDLKTIYLENVGNHTVMQYEVSSHIVQTVKVATDSLGRLSNAYLQFKNHVYQHKEDNITVINGLFLSKIYQVFIEYPQTKGDVFLLEFTRRKKKSNG